MCKQSKKLFSSKNIKANHLPGFTLIEILVVLSILSILAVFSFPFYSSIVIRNATSDAANSLAGSLKKAQTYAMAGKDGSNWGVEYSDSKITLLRESTGTVFDAYNVPPSIQISGIDHIIFFRASGFPDSYGEFTVSGNGETESIVLNSEGMVSVEE